MLYFRVSIDGLDDKIWRDIVVSHDYLLADLGYLILSLFDIHSSEYFSFSYDNYKYDCVLPIYNSDCYKSALNIRLKDINFKKNEIIKLRYDYNNEIDFNIKFLEMKDYKGKVPFVIDGEGKGAIDFVSGLELKDIVMKTDSTGVSLFSISTIDENDEEIEEIFDYREFDLEDLNFIGPLNEKLIKEEYELLILLDFFRIIKENKALFFKADIKEIVNPFDYVKEYLPDNYFKMTDSEKDKVYIPSDEELNIYMLPEYNDVNHKYIMMYYVKEYVLEKDARRDLFNALKNYHYMDKFYNVLRKYGLFKDYLNKTKFYYQDKVSKWIKENNIEI